MRIAHYLSHPSEILARASLKTAGALQIKKRRRAVSAARAQHEGQPFQYLDVGAAGGVPDAVLYARDQGLVNLTLLDLDENPWPKDMATKASVLSYALADYDGEAPVYIARHPGLTSLLKPNVELVKRFSVAEWFDTVAETTIPVHRAETLIKTGVIPQPHFVKLDVQGFEHQCLEGFGETLEDVLAIELEVCFEQLYVGQQTFVELRQYLRSKGFVLRDLQPGGLYGGELLEFNAYYYRPGISSAAQMTWEAIARLSPGVESVTARPLT